MLVSYDGDGDCDGPEEFRTENNVFIIRINENAKIQTYRSPEIHSFDVLNN